MSFGKKLEEFRVRNGINKTLLSKRAGIDVSHLSHIINGRHNPPKARTVERLIEVLRLSPEEAADLREEAKKRILLGNDGQSFTGKVISTL